MSASASTTRRSKIGLILLAYLAFISLGLPDGLLGVAWPSIHTDFTQPLGSLGILLTASTVGYLTTSFLSGRFMARLGVGGVLAASCFLTGVGLIGYTLTPFWGVMVALGVVAGLGAGAIDSGINTYVASNFSESLMQWLHASYGIGITLGPIIMTAGLNFFNSWRWGYRIVGGIQLMMAACFALTISMWRQHKSFTNGTAHTLEHIPTYMPERAVRLTDYKIPLLETLHQPAVWLSLLMFFIYTGVEVSFGNWTYSLLTLSRGVATEVAGLWAGSYWATFTVGRVLAGLLTRRLGVKTLVRAGLLTALSGAVLLWWNPFPAASILAVAIIGFSIAPVYPGLVSRTYARVGAQHAANTIGMQVAAAGLGAAVVPGIAGVLAQNTSIEAIPVYLASLFMVLLGLYILTARPRG